MTDDKYAQARTTYDAMSTRGLASKREYVRDLEQRADEDALARLCECLRDESWFMRELAEEAFMRLGSNGARALVPLLRQGLWFTRSSAARTLGRLGYGDAVPELFVLTEDANETAAASARDALVEIGHRGGAIRLAHALHRMPPDLRQRRVREIVSRDPALGERLERFMRSEDLMSVEDASVLSDESAAVRASEEGVVWEVLTAPSPPPPPPGDGDDGRA